MGKPIPVEQVMEDLAGILSAPKSDIQFQCVLEKLGMGVSFTARITEIDDEDLEKLCAVANRHDLSLKLKSGDGCIEVLLRRCPVEIHTE